MHGNILKQDGNDNNDNEAPGAGQDIISISHGARSPGNGTTSNPWSFLSDNANSNVREFVERQLSVNQTQVTPIHVLECRDAQLLIRLFISISGYVGGRSMSAFALNPFITNETENTVEELLGLSKPLTSKNPPKHEVDALLRCAANAGFNYVQTCVYIMNLMPESLLIPGARKLLFQSLDRDKTKWHSWREYSISDPTSLDQETVRSAYRQFNIVTEHYLSDLIGLLNGESIENTNIQNYKKWRDYAAYFKASTSIEEIFERERVLFEEVLDGLAEWNERKELLNKIVMDSRLGAAPAADRYYVELIDARNYTGWQFYLNKIIDWVNAKGITMSTPQAPAKPDQPPNKQEHRKKDYPVPKKQEPDLPRCQYCHKPGHTADVCFTIRNKLGNNNNRDYGNNNRDNGNNNRDNGNNNRDNGNMNNNRHRNTDNPTNQTHPPIQGRVQQPPQPPRIVPGAQPPRLADPTNGADANRPSYQTQFGRQIRPPNRGYTNMTQEASAETTTSETNSSEPENHCLRTVASSTQTKFGKSTETSAVKNPQSMPSVSVVLSEHPDIVSEQYTGILDTASNLNFVSRKVVNQLKHKYDIKESNASKLVIETMSGSFAPKDLKQIEISAALKDSAGCCTQFTKAVFLVHEGHIPGRNDFLLNSDWITTHSIIITGTAENGFDVRVAPTPTADKMIQSDCSDTIETTCCYSFAIEPDGDDDPFPEDCIELAKIAREQPERAVRMGPLTRNELERVSVHCEPIPLDLNFKPGCEHPPINESGYPTNASNESKLLKLLDNLVEEGILAETAIGSGTFICPGFPKQKGPDKVRLLVNLQAVNARILVPPEVKYHNATTWAASIPSYAEWFSCIDIRNAFYTIPASERSQQYLHMSIWTREGYRQYVWKRMPQGLSLSPAWWVEHLERCVHAMRTFLTNHSDPDYRNACKNVTILVYADDVLIAGEHQEDVRRITNIFHQHFLFNKMYVSDDKLQHTQQSVEVMGFKLGPGIIQVNTKNATKIRELTSPTNRKELNTALGLLNWLKWSLPDRGLTAHSPLNCLFELRDGRGKFQWEPRHQEAWDKIVKGFSNLALNTWSTLPGVA